MIEQFCTYKISLKLKQLGFDEPCLAIYRDRLSDFGVTLISDGINIKGTKSNTLYYNSNKEMICLAPLWQQVIDWFRGKYKIEVSVFDNTLEKKYAFLIGESFNNKVMFSSGKWMNDAKSSNGYYETFQEAREQAILKAIELIKK